MSYLLTCEVDGQLILLLIMLIFCENKCISLHQSKLKCEFKGGQTFEYTCMYDFLIIIFFWINILIFQALSL